MNISLLVFPKLGENLKYGHMIVGRLPPHSHKAKPTRPSFSLRRHETKLHQLFLLLVGGGELERSIALQHRPNHLNKPFIPSVEASTERNRSLSFRATTENGHNRHRSNCDRVRLGLGGVDPGVPDQYPGSAHPGAPMEWADAGLQAVAAGVQGSLPQLSLRPRAAVRPQAAVRIRGVVDSGVRAADRFHAPICRPLERRLVETDSYQALLRPVSLARRSEVPEPRGSFDQELPECD
ncbi:hypothetical protein C1H46_043012 [Malus baccata]|uniref:Uncharacterized protein n=1 Tax=Malus baccata TaxID=106549 RepID=A0A540KB41_MALBA|nr:hypothetical protein C1H46_043012 [Malus baccata]